MVDKSTVPVGTADLVRTAMVEVLKERGSTAAFDVLSNPEFLKEGAAIDDFMKPDRIIIGTDSPKSLALIEQLYAPFNRNRDRILSMDVRSAELSKYAANVMLATRISLMNELANLADRLGADIESVRRGIGSDPRIGFSFIYPGAGYGGSCFPKDVKALIHTAAAHGYDAGIVRGVEALNERQKERAVRQGRASLRRQDQRQNLRAVGPGLQTQHRRHPRRAESGADGSLVAGRCKGQGLRPRRA